MGGWTRRIAYGHGSKFPWRIIKMREDEQGTLDSESDTPSLFLLILANTWPGPEATFSDIKSCCKTAPVQENDVD